MEIIVGDEIYNTAGYSLGNPGYKLNTKSF
jgi:hypothetical protein